ncbi:MAG: tetratricopeptide repeat protein [Candidatus Moranbacteria bacterium]|nr:tetratricopeptide repeat protein [Candidatus Moranbacteria bacterium]
MKNFQLQKENDTLNSVIVKQEEQLNLEVLKQLQLTVDKEALKIQLRETKNVLKSETRKNSRVKQKVERLEESVAYLETRRRELKKENREREEQLSILREEFNHRQGELYKQLGTAYVKSEMFDLAIRAYEESLAVNNGDAEVHYNLGLLYYHALKDKDKAIEHFERYLRLSPAMRNRKEVEYMIKMLQ